MRKILCSLAVLAVCVGFAVAEEISGNITKIEGNKLTIQKTKFNREAKQVENEGAPITLTVSKDVKVVKGKRNQETKKVEAGEALSGGLKAEPLAKIGEKGVRVVVITDDSKTVTEIRVVEGRRGKD